METITLNLISDPGHGWCPVDASLVRDLGFADKISPYSYYHAGIVYLEEDCDFGLLIDAFAKKGLQVKVFEIYQENTPIRDYQHFKPSLINQ